MAFVARYGHQPVSEMLDMETVDLVKFAHELAEIVKAENTPSKQ